MDRFWSRIKIGKPDECWEWKLGKDKDGYGRFSYASKNILAHRFAWILTNGPIPGILCVLHKCDNPSCCNPNHLFLGTHKDNVEDAQRKRRRAIGQDHPQAKLTNTDVLKIRELYKTSNYKTIAKLFKVSYFTVWNVINKRTWSHI